MLKIRKIRIIRIIRIIRKYVITKNAEKQKTGGFVPDYAVDGTRTRDLQISQISKRPEMCSKTL